MHWSWKKNENVKNRFWYSISKFPQIIAFIDEKIGSSPLIIHSLMGGFKNDWVAQKWASHNFHYFCSQILELEFSYPRLAPYIHGCQTTQWPSEHQESHISNGESPIMGSILRTYGTDILWLDSVSRIHI